MFYMEYCNHTLRSIDRTVTAQNKSATASMKELEKTLLSNKVELLRLRDENHTESETLRTVASQRLNLWGCYFCEGTLFLNEDHLAEHVEKKHGDRMPKEVVNTTYST
jgi:hypothetical protein